VTSAPVRNREAVAALFVWTVCLLAASRPFPLPPEVKDGAALVAMLLVPGWSLAGQWPNLAPSRVARLGLAVPLSLAVLAVPVVPACIFGVPVLPTAAGYLFGTFLLLVRGLGLKNHRSVPATSPVAAILVVAAMGVAAWSGAVRGPGTDGPDHVTTVNEIILQGRLLPTQGLTADGEVDRVDPRKGIFHIALAAAAVISDTEAREVWQAAPGVLAAGWIALIFALGCRFGGSVAAGVWSAVLAFLFLGGPGGAWWPRSGYGAHVALLVSWSMMWVWLSVSGRGRGWLLAVLSATATLVHPMGAGFFVVPAGVGALVAVRSARRPLVSGVFAAVAGALPCLVYRWFESRGPWNPIHARAMPVLDLGGGWEVLWPGEGIRLLGVGLLAVPALWFLRTRAPEDRRVLAAATLTPLGIAFLPGVFGIVARFTSSFPIKLLYAVPFFLVLGVVLGSGWSRRGWVPRVLLGAMLAAAAPGALARFDRSLRDVGRTPAAEAALQTLRSLPGRVVVAADPWLSSLIAAETPHFPVTVLDQHGHPLDPRGLERLADLGLMISPWESPARRMERMLAYRVSHVAVAEQPGLELQFGCVRGDGVDRSRLDAFGPARGPFIPRGAGVIFVDLDRRDAASLRPLLVPPPIPEAGSWQPVTREDGACGGVELCGLGLPDTLRSGGTAPMILIWSRGEGDVAWPVTAHVRLTGVDHPPAPKWRRWLLGEHGGRLRADFPPFSGAWPPRGWAVGDSLADVEEFRDVFGLAPGRYAVSARVLPDAPFPRIELRDLVSNDDQWQGDSLGVITVIP